MSSFKSSLFYSELANSSSSSAFYQSSAVCFPCKVACSLTLSSKSVVKCPCSSFKFLWRVTSSSSCSLVRLSSLLHRFCSLVNCLFASSRAVNLVNESALLPFYSPNYFFKSSIVSLYSSIEANISSFSFLCLFYTSLSYVSWFLSALVMSNLCWSYIALI